LPVVGEVHSRNLYDTRAFLLFQFSLPAIALATRSREFCQS
jgi:hypothetical protein